MNKTLTFHGKEFIPDPSGALYWPAEDVLLVADLHFEKASHFARKGYMLPPYDTLETLELLGTAMARFAPKQVIALGDSWHDVFGPERIACEDQALLQQLCTHAKFTWISGNHDPKPTIFGAHVPHVERAGLKLVHDANALSDLPQLCGHYHPKVRIRLRRSSRALPCFALYDDVMVLPSFGAFTGGLEITHDALVKPLGMPHTVYACGKSTIYALPIKRGGSAGDQIGASVCA